MDVARRAGAPRRRKRTKKVSQKQAANTRAERSSKKPKATPVRAKRSRKTRKSDTTKAMVTPGPTTNHESDSESFVSAEQDSSEQSAEEEDNQQRQPTTAASSSSASSSAQTPAQAQRPLPLEAAPPARPQPEAGDANGSGGGALPRDGQHSLDSTSDEDDEDEDEASESVSDGDDVFWQDCGDTTSTPAEQVFGLSKLLERDPRFFDKSAAVAVHQQRGKSCFNGLPMDKHPLWLKVKDHQTAAASKQVLGQLVRFAAMQGQVYLEELATTLGPLVAITPQMLDQFNQFLCASNKSNRTRHVYFTKLGVVCRKIIAELRLRLEFGNDSSDGSALSQFLKGGTPPQHYTVAEVNKILNRCLLCIQTRVRKFASSAKRMSKEEATTGQGAYAYRFKAGMMM